MWSYYQGFNFCQTSILAVLFFCFDWCYTGRSFYNDMSYKNKGVLIAIISVLVLVILVWYFFIRNTNQIPKDVGQLTEQQKLELVSKTSISSTSEMSDTEKGQILDRASTDVVTASSSVPDEQKLQILNQN